MQTVGFARRGTNGRTRRRQSGKAGEKEVQRPSSLIKVVKKSLVDRQQVRKYSSLNFKHVDNLGKDFTRFKDTSTHRLRNSGFLHRFRKSKIRNGNALELV